MKKTELKPCPFCGGFGQVTIDMFAAYVNCNDCNACSGDCDTEKEAIEAWNRRVKDASDD